MSKQHTDGWFEDHGEMVTFARVLLATFGSAWGADDVIGYFEKPWRWSDEHANWCASNRPETLHEVEAVKR